ncbi:MAG: hypothetical protein LC117_05770 [Bacteroidia bacterium]|nr:hypothetical protein [Bacteroidia bacterium]MCZ2277419.1 hypothetical protein [Bacteroidia bacterium]
MKKILNLLFLISLPLCILKAQEPDYSECLVKVKSEWATTCSQCTQMNNTYRIYLKNNCDQSIESKVCVRETSNRWRIFHFKMIAPGDSVTAYACDGTGKYVLFNRKAGDMNILLPEDNEIQQSKY